MRPLFLACKLPCALCSHTGFPPRWQSEDRRSIFHPLLRPPALWDYGTTVRSLLNPTIYLQIQSRWSLGFQHTNGSGRGTIQSIAEISVANIISIFQISRSSERLPDSLEISQLDGVAGPGSQASWPCTPHSAPYTRCFVLTQQPHGSQSPQMISLATLSFGSAQSSPDRFCSCPQSSKAMKAAQGSPPSGAPSGASPAPSLGMTWALVFAFIAATLPCVAQ